MPQYRLQVEAKTTVHETWVAVGETPAIAFTSILHGGGRLENIGETPTRTLIAAVEVPPPQPRPAPVFKGDPINSVLVLSTAHLTDATCNGWLHAGSFPAWPKGEYGWILYASEEPGDIPDDLAGVLAYAHAQVCQWLIFDCDADTIADPGLPVFDW